MFDNGIFLANAPENLVKAQKLLEGYIKAFAKMSDIEAEYQRKYREKRSMLLKTAREASIQVSILSEYVKGDCAEEKEKCMKAFARKKKYQYMIDAMKERIFSIRHLSRSIEGTIKTQ